MINSFYYFSTKRKTTSVPSFLLKTLVRAKGLEPSTSTLARLRSSQLSYARISRIFLHTKIQFARKKYSTKNAPNGAFLMLTSTRASFLIYCIGYALFQTLAQFAQFFGDKCFGSHFTQETPSRQFIV